ncbi:MAG TPA: hypothetical protein VF594_02165, partial [Rubricoccaceae bacterium]
MQPEGTETPSETSTDAPLVDALADPFHPAHAARSMAEMSAYLDRASTAREIADAHDVPTALRSPLGELADVIAGASEFQGFRPETVTTAETTQTDLAEPATPVAYGAAGRTYEDVLSTVYGAFSAPALSRGDDGMLLDDGFDTAFEQVQQAFGPVLSEGDTARIEHARQATRRAWVRFRQATPTRQAVLDADGGSVRLHGADGLGTRDLDGSVVARFDAETLVERALRTSDGDAAPGVVRVSTLRLGGRTQPLMDLHEFDRDSDTGRATRRALSWGEAALHFVRSDMPLVSGVKDKGEAVALDRWTVPEDGVLAAAREKAAALDAAHVRAAGSKKAKAAGAEIAAFDAEIARMAGALSEASKGELTPEAAQTTAARLWLESVRLQERVGGLPAETMLYENLTGAGKHLLGETAWNKRAQVLFDGNPAATARHFDGVAGASPTGLKALVFDSEDVLRYAGADTGYVPFAYTADGAKPAEHHLDGATFVHPDVLARMQRDMGSDEAAGFLKASVTFGDAADGLFIGKQSFVPAPPQ